MTSVRSHILNPIRLVAAALTLLLTTVACGDVITLKSRATAVSETVRLQDVATLEGAYAQSLGEMKLTELGAVGDRESIELNDVRRELARAEANWAKLIVRGASRMTVSRVEAPAPVKQVVVEVEATPETPETPVAPVMATTLGGHIEAWVHERVGAVRGELRIEFGLGQDSILALPLSDYEFQIDPVAVSRIGAEPVNVRCWKDGEFVAQRGVALSVRKRVEVAVASRAIRNGAVLVEGDIEMQNEWVALDDRRPQADATWLIGQKVNRTVRKGSEWRMTLAAMEPLKSGSVLTGNELRLEAAWVEPGARSGVWDKAELVGKQLTQSVRIGESVFAQQLAAPRVVRRGQAVTLWCVVGAVVVKSVALAEDDGRVGDVIELERQGTKQRVFATVTGPLEAVVGPDASVIEVARGGVR